MIHYGLRRGHILSYKGNKAKTKEINNNNNNNMACLENN